MNTCLKLNKLAFPITVEQCGGGLFRITYGKQVSRGLTYAAAAKEFGECVFHALACDNKLDNSKA